MVFFATRILPQIFADFLGCTNISVNLYGASPNLHFHTLPGTQIYTTHIYTYPTVTQHQIYTGPKFALTQIYTASNLCNPILRKPKYTQPQNYTKPKFTQIQIYTGPNFTQPRDTLFPVSIFSCSDFLPGPNCLFL